MVRLLPLAIDTASTRIVEPTTLTVPVLAVT
jgi:hypothetical protein